MNNKIYFIILSYLCTSNVSAKSDMFDDFLNSFEVEMQSMKHQIQQTKEHAAKALKKAEQSVKNISTNLSLGVGVTLSEEKDSVKAVIDLQGVDKLASKASQIDIEAKDKSLSGTLKHDSYDVKFTITDGQIMRVSYQYNVKQKNEGYFQKVSSASTKSVVLPVRVCRLESAKAKFGNSKLVLFLPKENIVSRNGWHRIEVK